ncbi:MAG: response regulator [Candidatus Margulisiibacteriota bacterium]
MSHIMVIDDQASMREITTEMLRKDGFEVTEAGDGEEALKIFNLNPTSFDLIFADVNMPKIDGFEFLKKVKQVHPEIPVIFITGMDEEAVTFAGQEYHVNGIIKKPFTEEELLKTIKDALKK